MLALAGCAASPAPKENTPEVTSDNYDLLWDATTSVVSEHFELFAQRKDAGYIVSTYKRSEPMPSEYRSDPQTAYDTAEELMHVVRRRLTARILRNDAGVYVLHMEISRERQGYSPPRRSFSDSYNLYDARKSGIDTAADVGETVTWFRLGRDLHLERTLRSRIIGYMATHKPG